MPSIDQLEAFVSAAEEGSFSAAGRKLGKVQSSVSTQVMNLEIDLDVTLFDRTKRNPELTEEGRALLHHARAILLGNRELQACATALNSRVETHIRVALEHGVFKASLGQVFVEFSEQFPFVELEVLDTTASDVPGLLSDGNADIGIMVEQEDYPLGFQFRGIGHSRLVPVCGRSHPLTQHDRVNHAQLRQYRQIIVRKSFGTGALQTQHRKSPKVWICENPNLALDFLLLGFGWAELPEAVVGHKLEEGALHRIRYEFQQTEVIQGVDVVWTERNMLGPAGQWLLERLLADGQEIWPSAP